MSRHRGSFIFSLVAATAVGVAGCGEGDSSDRVDASAEYASSPANLDFSSGWGRSTGDAYGGSAQEERADFDEDAAREAAEEEMARDTYSGVGMPYGCLEDCSGHEAGYRYRADMGYVGTNPDTLSFNEGGQAFEDAVDERIDEMRDDYEGGGDAPY